MPVSESIGPARPLGSIGAIIGQHEEEAAFLWLLRDDAVTQPHYTLADIAALDSRLDAHIDGLRIAGDQGWKVCAEALRRGEPGEVFAAAVLAFDETEGRRLADVMSAAMQSAANFRALVSALGWIPFRGASGWIDRMLRAAPVEYRSLGIAGAAVRRLDPEEILVQLLDDEDPATRCRALRAAGELKRRDVLSRFSTHLQADHPHVRFWATRSAVLMGQAAALAPLDAYLTAGADPVWRTAALQLLLRVLDLGSAQNRLRHLAQDPKRRREAMIGCGVSGDPLYIPWLIEHMAVPEHARAAGEAFSMITGVDLAYEDLEGEWPEGFEAGPNEFPEDEDTALDPDEDLPWPEPHLIRQWWDKHKGRFRPGVRYLCGEPVGEESCRTILREGRQRQRISAAYELALMNRDEPLFEWRAPGFKQQRWLGVRP